MNSRIFLLALVALTITEYQARGADPLYEIELSDTLAKRLRVWQDSVLKSLTGADYTK